MLDATVFPMHSHGPEIWYVCPLIFTLAHLVLARRTARQFGVHDTVLSATHVRVLHAGWIVKMARNHMLQWSNPIMHAGQ